MNSPKIKANHRKWQNCNFFSCVRFSSCQTKLLLKSIQEHQTSNPPVLDDFCDEARLLRRFLVWGLELSTFYTLLSWNHSIIYHLLEFRVTSPGSNHPHTEQDLERERLDLNLLKKHRFSIFYPFPNFFPSDPAVNSPEGAQREGAKSLS